MGRKLTAGQVRDAVMSADRWKIRMGDTGITNTHLIIRDDGWQAIADELNGKLGNGECEWPTDVEGQRIQIADTIHMLRTEYDGDHEWEDVVIELVYVEYGGDKWVVRGARGEAWACECTVTGHDDELYDNSGDWSNLPTPWDRPEPDGWYKCPNPSCGCVVGYSLLADDSWTIYMDDYQIPFNHCPQCGKAVTR